MIACGHRLSPETPDPFGTTLTIVRRYFNEQEDADECLFFIDYTGLPQKPRSVRRPRADDESKCKGCAEEGCEACEGLEGTAVRSPRVERDYIHTPMAYAMDISNLLHALQDHGMGIHRHSTCPRSVVPTA